MGDYVRRTEEEIHQLHGQVLDFLGEDEGSTNNPHLSFECGVLATLDWLVTGADSVYSEIIDEDLVNAEFGDVTDPDWIARHKKRVKAMKRMCWDVWCALDHGSWGNPEEHFEDSDVDEKDIPYMVEARDRLLKEFERRSR